MGPARKQGAIMIVVTRGTAMRSGHRDAAAGHLDNKDRSRRECRNRATSNPIHS
jgi:hypothetical protein